MPYMTRGREKCGHQITRLVTDADVEQMRQDGWRLYDPDYENSLWSLLPKWVYDLWQYMKKQGL